MKDWAQLGVFHEHLSVDESMVPYRGLHGAHQYIRGKPILFGFKIWVICGEDGFPYKLEIYQGRKEGTKEPVGAGVVNRLVQVIVENSNVACHILY